MSLPGLSRSAACLAAALLAPGAIAGEPSNDQVEGHIDEITRGPEYDWLRDPGRPAGEAGEGGGGAKGGRRGPREGSDSGGGCGYEPGGSRPEPRDGERPGGDGCGAGASPGAGGGSAPAGSGSGCSGSPGGAGCGCDRTVGACDCGPGPASIASCGCGGVGAFGSTLGYLVGGIALALLVFLVARWILHREGPASVDADEEAEVGSPEDLRPSQVAAVPADLMMSRARDAAAAGDYRAAVGWSYLAALASLHRAGQVDLTRSTTNLGIVESTRRRGGPHEAVSKLVRVFEDLFFGGRAALEPHWVECRRIVEVDLAGSIATRA